MSKARLLSATAQSCRYWDFDRDDSDGSLKIADTGTERMRIASRRNAIHHNLRHKQLTSRLWPAGASIASGGNENTVAGDGSGAALSTGDQNVGVGHNALGALTTGSYNVGVGKSVLGSITTTSNNTAVGQSALGASTESNGTAIGINQGFCITRVAQTLRWVLLPCKV